MERLAARLAAPDGLTHRRSTFTRRDVIQALCAELPAGADVTAAEIEAVADRFLGVGTRGRARGGERSGVLRRRDGSVVPLVRDERVYSTPELLALERRLLDQAVGSQDAGLGVVRSTWVERAIARRPTIAGEQAEMVRRLTGDGAGVAVVVGQAGTGKTFALAAAREAWEAGGHVVLGAALARRAAQELEEDAGIPSTSVAALLEEASAAAVHARCRGGRWSWSMRRGWSPLGSWPSWSTMPLAGGRSWCWSAITGSSPRSRRVGRSGLWPRGCP